MIFIKKYIALLLSILLILSFCACGSVSKDDETDNKPESLESQQEKKYTQLSDGTYLYEEASIPSGKHIQFKDEQNNVLLDSSDILLVSLRSSEYEGYYIQLEFSEEGAIKFANATRENLGKQISIFLDEELISSPTVNSEITDGVVWILSLGSYDESLSFFNLLVK